MDETIRGGFTTNQQTRHVVGTRRLQAHNARGYRQIVWLEVRRHVGGKFVNLQPNQLIYKQCDFCRLRRHLQWCCDLPVSIRQGHHNFIHALLQANARDLRWLTIKNPVVTQIVEGHRGMLNRRLWDSENSRPFLSLGEDHGRVIRRITTDQQG